MCLSLAYSLFLNQKRYFDSFLTSLYVWTHFKGLSDMVPMDYTQLRILIMMIMCKFISKLPGIQSSTVCTSLI